MAFEQQPFFVLVPRGGRKAAAHTAIELMRWVGWVYVCFFDGQRHAADLHLTQTSSTSTALVHCSQMCLHFALVSVWEYSLYFVLIFLAYFFYEKFETCG